MIATQEKVGGYAPHTLKKEKMILLRYGAYGDMIFMSAVLPYLFSKYDIVFETNTKGLFLFANDPRFNLVTFYEPWRLPDDEREKIVKKHWDDIHEKYPDFRVLNFFQAMEGTGIVHESHPDATLLTQDERAAKYGINFYEQHFAMAGLDMPENFVPSHSIYLTPEEEGWGRQWRSKNRDSFIMLVPIAGSTLQKVFPTWLESFCKSMIDELPRLKIYLLGDLECADEDWEYKRTVSLIPRNKKKTPNFRQALIMAKYADYVFGPETGLLVGAGMWGTPKTTLMTGASIDQFAKYTLNDYSEQSTAPCSPCYRTCYTGALCQKEIFYGVYPRCTAAWDFEKLKNNIRDEYVRRNY